MIKQRQASLPGFDLQDLVAESIAFIRQHEPPEVVRFIRQHHPDVTWLYPQDSFWHMVVKKPPP